MVVDPPRLRALNLYDVSLGQGNQYSQALFKYSIMTYYLTLRATSDYVREPICTF